MGVQPTHKGEPSNALYEGGAEYSEGDLLKNNWAFPGDSATADCFAVEFQLFTKGWALILVLIYQQVPSWI